MLEQNVQNQQNLEHQIKYLKDRLEVNNIKASFSGTLGHGRSPLGSSEFR